MQVAGRLNPGKNQLIERHRAAPSIARGPCHGTAAAGKRGATWGATLPGSAGDPPALSEQGGRDARAPRLTSKTAPGRHEAESASGPPPPPAGTPRSGEGPPRP